MLCICNTKDDGRLGGNEVLSIFALLFKGLRESSQADNNSNSHETNGDDGPDDTPAARGTAIALGEDTGVGRVDLAEDQIVTDIPDAVE